MNAKKTYLWRFSFTVVLIAVASLDPWPKAWERAIDLIILAIWAGWTQNAQLIMQGRLKP